MKLVLADCFDLCKRIPSGKINLVYVDPPFNTGKKQKGGRIKFTSSNSGSRKGYAGRKYKTESIPGPSYQDIYKDYISYWGPRFLEMARILTSNGSLFIHIDYRQAPYVRVFLDQHLYFMNEIIWAYDYGARTKKRWPAKHDNILWYVKDPANYVFNYSKIDRIPYLAPSLQTPERRQLGKTPTTVWWGTIVPTNSKERTGYPTQKPRWLLERILKVHTKPRDWVCDPCAGSGTLGAVASSLDRRCLLGDSSEEAIECMQKRLSQYSPQIIKIGKK